MPHAAAEPVSPSSYRHPSAARRLSLAGLAAVGVSFGFARYGYGLFLPDIRAEFDLPLSVVGMIGSATYAGYLGALLLVGLCAARVGPRVLVTIGGCSATAGMAIVALAQQWPWLVAGLVLAGTSPGWVWAPFSDAVDRALPPGRRERVLALIPSGTAFGVAVAGPLAMVMYGTAWRYAWLVFAIGAFAATVYNVRVLPSGPAAPARERRAAALSLSWFARRGVAPLALTALSYGCTGSVYWLLAVDTITAAGVSGGGSRTAAVFWTITGVAGMTGVATGAVFARLGLRRSHVLIFSLLSVAAALLWAAPGTPLGVGLSAILYGPSFMAGSALLAVWSYQVFPERPTAGFSATVFFLGVGTIAGPATAGVLADRHGAQAALLAAAILAAATCSTALPSAKGAGPRRLRRRASPRP
ncbi:YbfB/YjiJ family MFS transporter [Phytoactinopolyspora halotolerans]|uniref:YbfB/YjiJ family MFS transporter n=1 Tax=Phytoactinopolyspora halotolerans TaxID=1981512 RepID=A0A6L9S2Q1_9ACTN|nr:YbfB/YjiJ family MFS transporter [Phytoactinopolyspora halotolerans]NED99090.1 YbfB/YjiJ family MFS transporter [Phytoactinopolyspora halotolerans]